MQPDQVWCHRRTDGKLEHFYRARQSILSLCVAPRDAHEVILVRIVEDPEGTMWAWRETDPSGGIYHYIYPSLMQISICFPCGLEAEEKSGRGKSVRVRIDPVDWIAQAVDASLDVAIKSMASVDRRGGSVAAWIATASRLGTGAICSDHQLTEDERALVQARVLQLLEERSRS